MGITRTDISTLELGSESEQVPAALTHLRFHHKHSQGYLTLATKEGGKFRSRNYTFKQAIEKLASSEQVGIDVYLSMNTFKNHRRREEDLQYLLALPVDIDSEKVGLDPSYAAMIVQDKVDLGYVPQPNYLLYSGRGIQVVWCIKPTSPKHLSVWKQVQKYLIEQFALCGVDRTVCDAARVLRLAGCTHGITGAEARIEYFHADRYDLHDLYARYIPKDSRPKPQQKQLKPKPLQKPQKPSQKPLKVSRFRNLHTLNYAMMQDLIKLVEQRNGAEGYRETMNFYYRHYSLAFHGDEQRALEDMLNFNQLFADPLSEKEAIRRTQTAERAHRKKFDEEANRAAQAKGYPAAGYNYKTETIIRELDITPEEQRHMTTLISPEEKQRRNTAYQRDKRRRAGAVDKSARRLDNLQAYRSLKEANPKVKQPEAAQILGLTIDQVKKLSAQLKKSAEVVP